MTILQKSLSKWLFPPPPPTITCFSHYKIFHSINFDQYLDLLAVTYISKFFASGFHSGEET
jgi:hypothetical protein